MFYGYPHKSATGDFLKARAFIPITPSYRKRLWVLKCLPIIITCIFINEELQFTPQKHTIIRQMHALCMLHTDISEGKLYKDRACFIVLCFGTSRYNLPTSILFRISYDLRNDSNHMCTGKKVTWIRENSIYVYAHIVLGHDILRLLQGQSNNPYQYD